MRTARCIHWLDYAGLKKKRYIYCLEGNWNTNPRSKQSVRPILELLYHSTEIKYIHRKYTNKIVPAFRLYKYIGECTCFGIEKIDEEQYIQSKGAPNEFRHPYPPTYDVCDMA